MELRCKVCGQPFDGRKDASTCSKKCRVALSRNGPISVTSGPISVTPGRVSVTSGTDKSLDGTDNPTSVTNPAVSVTSPELSVTNPAVSVTPALAPREVLQPGSDGEAVYKSQFGKEWDIMPDGYARGEKVVMNGTQIVRGTTPWQRIDTKTPYAYFRIIQQETGFNILHARLTRREFDAVDWKRLNLPNFDKIGKSVRDRLPEKSASGVGDK